MPYVVGNVATIRKGQFIPGGKPFEVSQAEVESLQAAGFKLVPAENPDRPNNGGINMSPDIRSERITGNFPGEIPDFDENSSSKKFLTGSSESKTAPRMGGTSVKAKTVSKTTSKPKEGSK